MEECVCVCMCVWIRGMSGTLKKKKKRQRPDICLIMNAQCFWNFINLYLDRLCQTFRTLLALLFYVFINKASKSHILPLSPCYSYLCSNPPSHSSPPNVLILISHLSTYLHEHILTHTHTQTETSFCWPSHYLLLADVKRCMAHLQCGDYLFPANIGLLTVCLYLESLIVELV